MNQGSSLRRIALGAALLAGALAYSCGGGGGGGGGGMGGLEPTFVGDVNGGPGLSMSAGAVTGDMFQLRINVISVNNFFGAAFRVTFNPASVSYSSVSGTGSFIAAGGAATRFDVDSSTAGVLLVDATRVGQLAGVNAAGTQLLVTLTFEATAETAANNYAFGPAATREVQTCASVAACSVVADNTLNWTGGTLSVTMN